MKKEKDLDKVKGFVTHKCSVCNNVMRDEYNPTGKHKLCKVCDNNAWKKIIIDEEGREGVIQEIEKLLLPMFADKQDTVFKDDYILRRKEWEGIKNGNKQG